MLGFQKLIWLIEIKKIKNTKICCYYDLNSNANSLNETVSLNQMHVLFDFWKMETENKLLYFFSFLHKLSFENSFCFLSILSCQTSFFIFKNRKLFLKIEKKKKKQLPNISL